MKKRFKWTKREDKVLVHAIQKYPHNKAKAFREASKEIGCSTISCQNRWYKRLSNPENKNYMGCKYTLISKYSRIDNRTKGEIIHKKINTSIWDKIKKILNLK